VVTAAALWGFFTRDALARTRPHHYLEAPSDLTALVARLERERAA
jgi:hypothetical protein